MVVVSKGSERPSTEAPIKTEGETEETETKETVAEETEADSRNGGGDE